MKYYFILVNLVEIHGFEGVRMLFINGRALMCASDKINGAITNQQCFKLDMPLRECCWSEFFINGGGNVVGDDGNIIGGRDGSHFERVQKLNSLEGWLFGYYVRTTLMMNTLLLLYMICSYTDLSNLHKAGLKTFIRKFT